MNGLRIIVADDDPLMRQFYQAVLANMRHHVIAGAAHGRELVSACLEQAADLVVTDIRMPEMDGLEAARIVWQHRSLPFVFVSAYCDEALINSLLIEYSCGYLVKPIKPEDLAASISVAMKTFREHR